MGEKLKKRDGEGAAISMKWLKYAVVVLLCPDLHYSFYTREKLWRVIKAGSSQELEVRRNDSNHSIEFGVSAEHAPSHFVG